MVEKYAQFLKHRRFDDERGWLSNINAADFVAENPDRFVHRFVVHSVKNTLRGFHFQEHPKAQEKIVYVLQGNILDVSFCLSDHAASPKLYASVLGDGENYDTAYISSNMAHAYLVMSETATLLYLNSAPYDAELARVIDPLDKSIQFDWGVPREELVISMRDRQGISLANYRGEA
jgi:dTDP-4-dehydrorhamnose 3,5-epimerase